MSENEASQRREEILEGLLIAEIHHEHELVEKRLSRFYLAITGIGLVAAYFIDRNESTADAWIMIAAAVILLLSVAFTLSIAAAYASQKKLSEALDSLSFKSVYSNRNGKLIPRLGFASAISIPAILILLSVFLFAVGLG